MASPRLTGSFPVLYGESTALQVGAVYRCVKLLSESVAGLPLRCMKRRGDIYVDTSEHMWYLLNVQPDPNYSAFEFWRQAVTDILLRGNAYIVPVYNPVSMDLDRLVLCGRGTVAHDTTSDTYTVTDDANDLHGVYGEAEIIHLKGLTLRDPKQGVSVLTYAAQTVSTASAGERETENRFTYGGNVRGLVSNGAGVRGYGEYQDEQLSATAVDLDARFSRGEKIVSLPGQVDFKQLSLSSTDMQFLESRKFAVLDVCRFFGVPPSFVYEDTSTNYKSAEQASVAFLTHTLNPLLRAIEIELLRKLVSPARASRYRFEFDRRGLYTTDLGSKVKYQAATIAAGIYTVNDWRQLENHAPVEGGDIVLVSANLRPITEASKPTPVPTLAPAEQDEPENEKEDSDENE